MKYKAIHIPTATLIEIPTHYCYDIMCMEQYLSSYAWVFCIKPVDNRYRMYWLTIPQEERDKVFKYKRYEFDIVSY